MFCYLEVCAGVEATTMRAYQYHFGNTVMRILLKGVVGSDNVATVLRIMVSFW